MASETEDRTLPATDRRREQARAEGQAPLSRELVAASGLGAMTLLAALIMPASTRTLGAQLEAMLAAPAGAPGVALFQAGWAMLQAILPVAGAMLLAGSAAVLLQTGFLVHGAALLPDLARLNPQRGFKRVFSLANAVEALKSVAKVAVIGWAVWHVLAGALSTSAVSLSWTLPTVLDHLARETLHVLLVVLGCQCAIALLDTGWVRFQHAKRLRMSLEEIKQEQKEADGDPKLKAKIKQIRLMRARRRMMAAVAKATVVVTNPTHYAVALSYDRGSRSAPKVVAKGVDDVAARIREEAKKHGIPLFPSPPLARALHGLQLDAEVPEEHFKAVAEIIAYVWRLRSSGSRIK